MEEERADLCAVEERTSAGTGVKGRMEKLEYEHSNQEQVRTRTRWLAISLVCAAMGWSGNLLLVLGPFKVGPIILILAPFALICEVTGAVFAETPTESAESSGRTALLLRIANAIGLVVTLLAMVFSMLP